MPTDEWIVLLVVAAIVLLLLCLVVWEPAYWAYRAWRLKRAFYLRDQADKAAKLSGKRGGRPAGSSTPSGETRRGQEGNSREPFSG